MRQTAEAPLVVASDAEAEMERWQGTALGVALWITRETMLACCGLEIYTIEPCDRRARGYRWHYIHVLGRLIECAEQSTEEVDDYFANLDEVLDYIAEQVEHLTAGDPLVVETCQGES